MEARLSILLYSLYLVSFGSAETFEPFVLHLASDGFYDSTAQFTIGSPADGAPTTLKAIFDTGTFQLWTVAPGSSIPGKHTKYDGTRSTKYSTENKPLSEPFSGAKIEGRIAEDIVQLGSVGYGITLTNQKFGEATKMGEHLNNIVFNNYDAIFGLDLISQEALDGMPLTPVMRIAERFDPVPKFGFFLDLQNNKQSRVVFGNKDEGLYTGQFSNHAVVKRDGQYRGWNVHIDKIVVEHVQSRESNEIPRTDAGTDGFSRIMTRSTAMLLGPKEFIKKLNEEVYGRYSTARMPLDRKDYTFPCVSSSDMIDLFVVLPNIHFYIDGVQFTFRPQEYVGISENDSKCRTVFYGDNIEYFILGSPFIAKYYTRFDYQNKMVQFAKAQTIAQDIHISELTTEVLESYRESSRQADVQKEQERQETREFFSIQGEVTWLDRESYLQIKNAAKYYYNKDEVTKEEIQNYVQLVQQQ